MTSEERKMLRQAKTTKESWNRGHFYSWLRGFRNGTEEKKESPDFAKEMDKLMEEAREDERKYREQATQCSQEQE